MYDDSLIYPLSQELSAGEEVHLCPECRDLMAAVINGRTPAVPEPPARADWERALAWLDAQCGGRDAVLHLGDRPLDGAPPAPPTGVDPDLMGLMRATGELLDAVGDRYFSAEFALACRRALALAFDQRPGVVVNQRPEALAHGVTWAVARANGVLYPAGIVSDRSLREFFNSRQPGSGIGRKVQVAVRSLFTWSNPLTDDWRWPVDQTPLDPLGQPSLLLATTRRRLVEVRDRALHEATLSEPS